MPSTEKSNLGKHLKEKIASLIYNLFVRTSAPWLNHASAASKFWHLLWRISCLVFARTTVQTTIHGYSALTNYGYTYPLYTRRFASFNNPLVELVYQSYDIKKTPITLVDVGAAVGDTILLIKKNCPEMLGSFYAVDGDPEFFRYLQKNLETFKGGHFFLSLLSSQSGPEPTLVRIHEGTASSQGTAAVSAITLDSLCEKHPFLPIDILKIDADGMDGKILSGAQGILDRDHPAVIFEWHPTLYEKTGNDWTHPFVLLTQKSYQRFGWFDKYGCFSHWMSGYNVERVKDYAQQCLQNKLGTDWHYDIIALSEQCSISSETLAALPFAKHKRSPY